MKPLTIREMRQGYQALQEALEKEGEVTLNHHGKPFAHALPIKQHKEVPSHAALRAAMPFQEVPSEVLIREDRDAR